MLEYAKRQHKKADIIHVMEYLGNKDSDLVNLQQYHWLLDIVLNQTC